eukprot:gnl/MRDRNA2_/MRDRNA2_144828_c0_seq1.p1 gnl/MRDRNA2_/MRDRNA2_144828_c0~~gnl/MRDRNA2_/MRDRNA2_144828_c0_seq1.p1  ORF type:complete len:380 (-),score=73.98 gnl/MRDRNA2_/MRDRNA2_144828_c0_seq1:195-1334(-)
MQDLSQASPGSTATQSEAFAQSEQKRQEALDWVDRARRQQAQGNSEGGRSAMAKAWRCLEESVSICPSNHRARFLVVSCAMNADDYKRAKSEAVRIYQDHTKQQLQQMNDSVLHLSIAHAAKMLGEIEFGIQFALEATELYRDDPQPYLVSAELHEILGHNREAEQMCRQALMHNDSPNCKHRLNSQNVFFTLCCLGSALVKQGKYSEAELFIHRAIQIDSASTLGFRHLVDVYHFQGRFQEALQTAQGIREKDPADKEIAQKMDRIRHDMARKTDRGTGDAGPRRPEAGRHNQRSLSNGQNEDHLTAGDSMAMPRPDTSGPTSKAAYQYPARMDQNYQGPPSISETSGLKKPSQKQAPPKKDNEWWNICCLDRDEDDR